jgi:hypothetical protein
MSAGKWDQTDAFGKPNSLPAITTEMTDPYSLAFLQGEDDAKSGHDASPPDDGDADHWLAYMEGYARDQNLLPWEA